MTSEIYGWCGKILKVDLSISKINELNTRDYADRFLGGRGIATRIYYDSVKPGTAAFDPDNCLILMNGPTLPRRSCELMAVRVNRIVFIKLPLKHLLKGLPLL